MQNLEKLSTWLRKYQIADDLAGTVQNCKICNNEFIVRKSGLPPRYGICKKCKCSFTSKNRQSFKEKSQEAKLKSKATWKAKSLKEKQEIIEKRKATSRKTYASRTQEEKQKIGKHISDVQKNFSEDKKLAIRNKKSKAKKLNWSLKSLEERKDIGKKISKSHNSIEFIQNRQLREKNLTESQKIKRREVFLANIRKVMSEKGTEIIEKRKKTIQSWTKEQKEIVRAKRRATWLAKSEKEKQVALEKFRNSMSNKTVEEKRNIRSKAVHRYEYDNEYFDSSWELALWIYAKDHNEDINRHPAVLKWYFQEQEHEYYPDFEYKGNLVELKGDQFFKSNGDLYCPYDRSLDALMKAKQDFMIASGVKILRKDDLNFVFDYIEKAYTFDYINLFKKDLEFPYPSKLYKNPNDLNIIQYFHKSIYEASRKGKLSPLEAWQRKDLIKKAALNRLQYVKSCKLSDILQGFNVAKIAPKVSVFKPKLAENLIQKYLSDFNTIVDPFSGFSGRMLGATNLKKRYLGFDINEKHVLESKKIIEYKNIGPLAEVSVENILEAPIKNFDNSVSLFTCPPYGGKEHWNENNDEIEKSCDEWIDICLDKYRNCGSYLFVVDKTEKYADSVVDRIENKSHFGSSFEQIVLIHKK